MINYCNIIDINWGEMSLFNRALIGLGGTLAILGIPAYYYIQSDKKQK